MTTIATKDLKALIELHAPGVPIDSRPGKMWLTMGGGCIRSFSKYAAHYGC